MTVKRSDPPAWWHPGAAAKRVGRRLLRSNAVLGVAARLLHWALKAIYRSNRPIAASQDVAAHIAGHRPVIMVLWHGRQMLVQYIRPKNEKAVGLVSRSADAEINARVIALAGNQVIRGSGGRRRKAMHEKGGVRALLALREALAAGRHVVMVADVPKKHPRQVGEGVVRLAKMSGRPIVPLALSTSRRFIIDSAWDKMTINLPFGRRCLRLAEPIYVPADADEAAIAALRERLTAELDRVTREADELVEAR